MNVLFFSNEFPGPHDPYRAVFNLRMCEALGRRHQVRVVAPVAWTNRVLGKVRRPTDQMFSSIEATYPTYYFVPRVLAAWRGRFMWLSVSRVLHAVTAAWHPDVILTYWTYPDGAVGLRLGRRIDVPVVQMVGGSDVLLTRRRGARWREIRRVLTGVDAVVTMGRDLARQVTSIGVAPECVTGLYRPVPDHLFGPGSRSDARTHLGLPSGHSIVLWVGRFAAEKGLQVLVESLGLLQQPASRPLLVCLIGDGPQREAMQSIVARRALNDRVRFVGLVPNEALAHWYRAADVTVLPSLSEGVPNVLLESIACGTPFVASAVGGIPEVADARLDRLVPPGDPASLAAALEDLLARPQTPARIQRRFMPSTVDEFGLQLETVLARATASRSRARATA